MIRCDACRFKEYGINDYPCSECDATNNMFKPKAITNADKIRAMTDEELAEFLNTLFIEGQIEAIHEQYPDSVFNRKDDSLKWLQSEAE